MEYLLYIFLIALVLAVIGYMYLDAPSAQKHDAAMRMHAVNDTLAWLHQTLNLICYYSDISASYSLRVGDTVRCESSDSGMHTIYIVIWDSENQRLYDTHTLLYAVIYALSHAMSDAPDALESVLINAAIKLGYFDTTLLNPNYYKYGVPEPWAVEK